jgi:hypothetical protein
MCKRDNLQYVAILQYVQEGAEAQTAKWGAANKICPSGANNSFRSLTNAKMLFAAEK